MFHTTTRTLVYINKIILKCFLHLFLSSSSSHFFWGVSLALLNHSFVLYQARKFNGITRNAWPWRQKYYASQIEWKNKTKAKNIIVLSFVEHAAVSIRKTLFIFGHFISVRVFLVNRIISQVSWSNSWNTLLYTIAEYRIWSSTLKTIYSVRLCFISIFCVWVCVFVSR